MIMSCFQNSGTVRVTVPEATVAGTGDVDLCLGASPEKSPCLDMSQQVTRVSISSFEEHVRSKPGYWFSMFWCGLFL
jgi:hypothetical protein